MLSVYSRIASGKPSGIESVYEIAVGSTFSLGGKELEVDCPIQKSEFMSGKYFGGHLDAPSPQPSMKSSSSTLKPFKPLRPKTLNSPKVATPPAMRSSLKKGETPSSASLRPEKVTIKHEDSSWSANWYDSPYIYARIHD